jgi:3-hydroxybutyrate dehydrogenase
MLKGNTALITGSISGLGFAIAQELAQVGANIVLHGLETESVAAEAKKQLEDMYKVHVMVSHANLKDVRQIEDMMRQAKEQFGQVDIVVNNAVTRSVGLVDELPTQSWDDAIAINLSAAFHTIRLAVPAMRQSGWGRIINMSSVFGTTASENRISYITTKTALIGLTRSVAMDCAKSGITCNALCPGTVPTKPILDKIAGIAQAEGISEEQAQRNYISTRHPTGRFVSAKSVAGFVVFLCSEAGQDITGAVLPVDGGHTIK